MRAPLVEAEQDGSIRIQDLTKVVMARRRLGLAKERLVPFEAAADVATPMIVHVRFIAFPLSASLLFVLEPHREYCGSITPARAARMALFMQIAVCVSVRRLLVCTSAGFAILVHTANTAALQQPVFESRSVSRQERADAIGRAHVWRAPKVPIASARLTRRPQGSFSSGLSFPCRAARRHDAEVRLPARLRKEASHQVPGHVPEIPAEVAATRLLSALGFGADQVTLVERIRCYGCPINPFRTTKVADTAHTQTQYERSINYQRFTDFDWVAVEERLAARPSKPRATKDGRSLSSTT